MSRTVSMMELDNLESPISEKLLNEKKGTSFDLTKFNDDEIKKDFQNLNSLQSSESKIFNSRFDEESLINVLHDSMNIRSADEMVPPAYDGLIREIYNNSFVVEKELGELMDSNDDASLVDLLYDAFQLSKTKSTGKLIKTREVLMEEEERFRTRAMARCIETITILDDEDANSEVPQPKVDVPEDSDSVIILEESSDVLICDSPIQSVPEQKIQKPVTSFQDVEKSENFLGKLIEETIGKEFANILG